MARRHRVRIRGRFSTSVVVTVIAGGVLAASGWAAAGNTISVTVPSDAHVSPSSCQPASNQTATCKTFSVTLKGHATSAERLYMFLDFKACGANPAVEHARANGSVWSVEGSYKEVSKGWVSYKRGTDHVCAYLQKASEVENSPGGILAHKFASFKVH